VLAASPAATLDAILPPLIVSRPKLRESRIPIEAIQFVEIAEMEEELKRFGQLIEFIDTTALSSRLVIRVDPSPPTAVNPALRVDERPNLVWAISCIDAGVAATDLDLQSRILLRQATTNTAIAARWPDFAIKGTFDIMDERVRENSRELDAGFFFKLGKNEKVLEPSLFIGKQTAFSRMGWICHMAEGQNFIAQPRASARVMALVTRRSSSARVGLLFLNSGLTMSSTASEANGLHQAASAIVSRATLMSVGRCLGLPWWRCIRGDLPPDNDALAVMRRGFLSLPEETQLASVQHLLTVNQRNYNPDKPGVMDEATHQALIDFAESRGRAALSTNLSEAYVELLSVATTFPFEPLALPPQPGTKIMWKAIKFIGFPRQAESLLPDVLEEVRAWPKDRAPADATSFHVRFDGSTKELGDAVARAWLMQTGRKCRIHLLGDHRLRVEYVAGFRD
jgi:hypothetical protein